MHDPLSTQAAAVPLRLFSPEDCEDPTPQQDGQLSPEMTLTDFFWRYAWPDCFVPKGDGRRTRKDYETSLRYWRELTGDPPLGKISKRHCATFVRRVGAVNGNTARLSQNTVHKHWVNIQRLLNLSGPSSRQQPDGADVLENPPWLTGPGRSQPAPRAGFSLDEIWRWLEILPRLAVRCAKNADFDPVDWWRGLILVAYNTGARPATLFQLRSEWIDDHVLRVPPEAIKGRHGRLLWLNDPALEAIRKLRKPKGLIFGWERWPEAETTLRKHRRRQQRPAGVRDLGFYGFRRTFATECGKISPLAMQIMLGHEGLGLRMAAQHYVCLEEVLADALQKLPQPGRQIQQQLF